MKSYKRDRTCNKNVIIVNLQSYNRCDILTPLWMICLIIRSGIYKHFIHFGAEEISGRIPK